MPETQAEYIRRRATELGLDANAVLAVSYAEGGGRPGDYVGGRATSFGPFQLHEGGRLPDAYRGRPDAAQAWAMSPGGIDYALKGIAGTTAAHGLQGKQAIWAIINEFENPQDKIGEYARASTYYLRGYGTNPPAAIGGSLTVAPPAKAKGYGPTDWQWWASPVYGGGGIGDTKPSIDAVKGAARATVGIGDFLGRLSEVSTWIRVGQFTGGILLIAGSIVVISREGLRT